MTTSCLPDRGRGSASRLVFQEESCWGTVLRTGQIPRGMDFSSESLRNNINLIESQLIRPQRTRAKPSQGNQRPGGDITGELTPGTWPILLKHALCQDQDIETVGSGPYRHHFNGAIDLPEGLTFEKRFGFRRSSDIILQYQGCRVNQFFWQVPNEGIVVARAGILARREVDCSDGSTTATANDDSIESHRAAEYLRPNNAFNTFHITLETEDDVTALVRSGDCTIDNNMDPEGFALTGEPYRVDLSEDVRAISGNLVVMFTTANYDRFYAAYLANEPLKLRWRFLRDNDRLDILLPSACITGEPTPAVGGRGPMDMNLQYAAYEDDDTGLDIQCTVQSSEARLSTAA